VKQHAAGLFVSRLFLFSPLPPSFFQQGSVSSASFRRKEDSTPGVFYVYDSLTLSMSAVFLLFRRSAICNVLSSPLQNKD
jgi:hypothetical protein